MWRISAVAVVVAACIGLAYAQQPGSGAQPPSPAGMLGAVNGHIQISGGATPLLTGGTLDVGSTDNQGGFVASATSGQLNFGANYNQPPWCDVTSYGGTGATYVVGPTIILFSTIVSGARYTYQCVAKPGG